MNTSEFKLENSWTSGIGEAYENGYTYWYYAESGQWEIYHYSDGPEEHVVQLYRRHLDEQEQERITDEYPERTETFGSEEESEQFAMELMRQYD